jgi:hypothetical protein
MTTHSPLVLYEVRLRAVLVRAWRRRGLDDACQLAEGPTFCQYEGRRITASATPGAPRGRIVRRSKR